MVHVLKPSGIDVANKVMKDFLCSLLNKWALTEFLSYAKAEQLFPSY